MVEHLEFGYFDVLSIPFQCFKMPSFQKFKTPRCAGYASKDASRKYHLVRYVPPCLYRFRWPSWLRRLRTRAFPRSLSHCATAYILYRVIAPPEPPGRTSRCPPRCRSGARPWSDRRASPQASSRPHLQAIEHAIDGLPVFMLCEGRFHSSSSSRIGLSSQLSSRSAHLGQRSSQLMLS